MSRVKGRKIRGSIENNDEIVVNGESEKRIEPKKIKVSYSGQADVEVIEDEKIDRELEVEDNMSIATMLLILIICFVVGIVVGYLLYRLAIDNSNTLSIIFKMI